MNKADHIISEDETIEGVISRQKEFLKSKGFRKPIICPVSSRAAYLAKKSRSETLSRLESRELDNYIDKFEQISLSPYYENILRCAPIIDNGDETLMLLKNCGLSYIENIIYYLSNGGKLNDTSIC